MKTFEELRKDLREDERADTHWRTEARRAFALMGKSLQGKSSEQLNSIFQALPGAVFATSAADLGFPRQYWDLVLAFGSHVVQPFGADIQSGNSAFFTFIKDSRGMEHPMIFVPVFLDNKPNLELLKKLDTYPDVEQSFIHEFIHYLDYMRFKDPESTFRKKLKPGQKAGIDINSFQSMYSYVNSPAEFNAYYQELITRIEHFLHDTDTMNIAKLTTFPEFMIVARKFIPTFMRDYLNDGYKRKLIKRLYSFWKEKINDIKDK